ncbi:hypothetical protein H2248_012449 [Termitomyces sp. 'cryptogamus']|nr:hypothetical protein H2248_012449 [Termitomyces sp. 'cryptogamus']
MNVVQQKDWYVDVLSSFMAYCVAMCALSQRSLVSAPHYAFRLLHDVYGRALATYRFLLTMERPRPFSGYDLAVAGLIIDDVDSIGE